MRLLLRSALLRVSGSGLVILAIAGCGGSSSATQSVGEDANNAPRLQTELEYQKSVGAKKSEEARSASKKAADFYSTKVPIPRR